MINKLKNLIAKLKMPADAADIRDENGRLACSSCGTPTDSWPCSSHQPRAALANW